jgi:tyrosine-specific transport protein
MKDLFKNYFLPMAVFSGGMIGVGFLSLPYIAEKVGIWLMLLYFLIITALIIVINSIFCDISLKTPDFKRFPGFVEFYLGKRAKWFAIISVVFGGFGVLLAYLLVGGQFLALIFPPLFSGSIFAYVLIYFFIACVIIYFDIEAVAKTELWIIGFLFLSLIIIFLESVGQIKINNIFSVNADFNVLNLFLPYGPLLFALWGIGLVPEVEEMIKEKKDSLKKIITISTIIVSVFYFLFVLLIIGITGNQTDQTALQGLKNFLPSFLFTISLLIGVLTTFIAFIAQGIILKKTFIFDLKIKPWQAFIMTCFPPMIFYLMGFKSFITLVSFIGGVFLGINGILILLMYRKIGGKNVVIYPLSFIFLLGIIYEIIYFIK